MKKASVSETKNRLSRLERSGMLRLGRGELVERIVSEPAPRQKQGAGAVAALLEERDAGR